MIRQEVTSDANGIVYTDTTYDDLGRRVAVSNPYYSTSDPTYGVNYYTYDALGRLTNSTDPGGFGTYYTYSGRAKQIQYYPYWMNKQTIYQSDGLGRTVAVCEVTATTQMGTPSTPTSCGLDISGNGFKTLYYYDALNNLYQVNHPSGAQRNYGYDALSRLTSAYDPEVGTPSGYNTIYYSYDAQSAGDLYQRTAPAPNQAGAATVTTTYGHDALHRLTSITYSDNTTPWKFLLYDQTTANVEHPQNPAGRLTAALTCPSGITCGATSPPLTNEIFSYDPVGRILYTYQCTPSTCPSNNFFTLPYTYDYIGDMLTAGDGTGITFTNQFNAVGELNSVSTNWLSQNNQSGSIVSGIQYNALGKPVSDMLGNEIQETWGYAYDGNQSSYTAKYNGNTVYSYTLPTVVGGNLVFGTTDSVNGNWTYSYDNMARVSGGSCSGACPFGESAIAYNYTYDIQGNRWQQNLTQGTGNNISHTFGAWNHVNDGSTDYDSAGNTYSDGTNVYTYDPEGQLLSLDSNSAVYTYDAFGRRVTTQDSSGSFEYLFDLGNHRVATLQSGSRVGGEAWFGRHWTSNTGTELNFMLSDWLGGGRVWTDLNANVTLYCQNLPFGDELYCWGGGNNFDDVFAGLKYNFDDSLYDSQSRQLNPLQARWTVPDPAGLTAVDPSNPQTWNRYGYVGNNPTGIADPAGMYWNICDIGFIAPDGYPGCLIGPFPVFLPVGWGGGGGGGGGNPVPGNPNPPNGGGTHGPWPGNQTTGLPRIPNQPLSLGDLLGLNPNGPCDFGVCAPIGNGFAPAAAVGAFACLADPVCAAVAVGVTVVVTGIEVYKIYRQSQTQSPPESDLQGCTLNAEFKLPNGAKSCAYKCKGWPAANVTTTCQAHQSCRAVIPAGVVVNPQTACE